MKAYREIQDWDELSDKQFKVLVDDVFTILKKAIEENPAAVKELISNVCYESPNLIQDFIGEE